MTSTSPVHLRPTKSEPTSITIASPPITPSGSRPGLYRSSGSFSSFMNRQSLDRYGEEWGTDALTLLDVVETFFDSRLDLFNRRLKAQSARLKSRAVELLPKGLRTPSGGGILLVEDEESGEEGNSSRDISRNKSGVDLREKGEKYKRDVEREVERIKVKLATKVTALSVQWRSAQVVKTREKISFLAGILTLTFTCLLYGTAPEWLPTVYSIMLLIFLPIRAYDYHKKAFHYFLADLCYFVNILVVAWLWIFPSSTRLFISVYMLTMGPLASAIITWRNAFVPHSVDKMISLFIHMYPPLILTIIRHILPNAKERYPGLEGIERYHPIKMILLSAIPYCAWQGAYYKFISVDRKAKVESGERQNSFHYMLNDKRGPIGKILQRIRPEHRELWFIGAQFIYSIFFMIPPAFLLIHSPLASSIFLIIIFSVSSWNGAQFYLTTMNRRFERELERLRRELELATATGGSTSSAAPSTPGTPYVEASGTSSFDSAPKPHDDLSNSPLVLPSTEHIADVKVPDLHLGAAASTSSVESRKNI